jgi:hypothetical protein
MIKYLFIIPFVFILVSCEKTQIVESDVPNQNYVVVNSELDAESLFKGVTFTKTLPLGVPYDIKEAELKDVTAYIKINGVQVIPLHYLHDGVYIPLYEFLIQAGNTYELFAEGEGTVIYSITKVPFAPEINNVSYNAAGNYLQANIKANEGEVYGAIWVIGNGIAQASTFPNLSIPSAGATTINVITSGISDQYTGGNYNGMRNIQVFSYDRQYTAYFNSVKVTVPSGNAFLQNGGTTGWNVIGNNVIGMFIGVSKGITKNVN